MPRRVARPAVFASSTPGAEPGASDDNVGRQNTAILQADRIDPSVFVAAQADRLGVGEDFDTLPVESALYQATAPEIELAFENMFGIGQHTHRQTHLAQTVCGFKTKQAGAGDYRLMCVVAPDVVLDASDVAGLT